MYSGLVNMTLHCFILIISVFLIARNLSAKSIINKYGCGDPENEWAHIIVNEKPLCYKSFDTGQSFESAEKSCSELHNSSHLASFHSKAEFQAIAVLLLSLSGSAPHFWTGLYRLNETSLPTFNEEFALPYLQFYFTDASKYNWPIPVKLLPFTNKSSTKILEMHSDVIDSALASPEPFEEPKFCVQVKSHHGEIVLQEQDCAAELKFVCKKPATPLHSLPLTHPLFKQVGPTTTEKSLEFIIEFSPNRSNTLASTLSAPKSDDSTATNSSTNSTEILLREFIDKKTTLANLPTTSGDTETPTNPFTTPTADDEHTTTDKIALEPFSVDATTTSDTPSTTECTETSSLDLENEDKELGEHEEELHKGSYLPCFSIATFTWTCVEGEVLMVD